MAQIATIRLFKGVHVPEFSEILPKFNEAILDRTVKNGFIIDPRIPVTETLLVMIEEVLSTSGERMNATFHKSWDVVRDTPLEVLFFQQIMHYMTTYGFETLGIYNEATVFIPHERLDIPEIKESFELKYIKAMSTQNIRDEIIKLGSAGIALSEKVLQDMMDLVYDLKFKPNFIDLITNREFKIRLYDHYNMAPSDPEEFLRYAIVKLTDESLVIKNDYLINKIKNSNGKFIDMLMSRAPNNLASIFYRYKPIFLAMKSAAKNKTVFNQLRKKATKFHKPLPEDYLNNVTASIIRGTLSLTRLENKITNAPMNRKIRLAQALINRINGLGSIVYRVRNGKGYATDMPWNPVCNTEATDALCVVTDAIAADMAERVNGRIFRIPQSIRYAMPATEKQFVGNVPTNSYVTVLDDLVCGIHWTNTEKTRVDLDISMIDVSTKFGWDANYRSKDGRILFSGDLTDAPQPKGATELFYVRNNVNEDAKIVIVNHYNRYEGDEEIPCKIIASNEKIGKNFKSLAKNYMVNPNNIIMAENIIINNQQCIIGMIVRVKEELRFYFTHMSVDRGMTASRSSSIMHSRKYLVSSMLGTLSLNDMIVSAGGKVVSNMEETLSFMNEEEFEICKENNRFIDLSPKNLDKTTIIDLIYGNNKI